MAHAHPKPWTVEEFLEWERSQEERYEYIGGMIIGMVGGTADHNTIVLNLAMSLRQSLRGRPCRVFTESMKVLAGDMMTYPDVVVTCAPVSAKADSIPEPVVVVEVLSRRTESFARGEKWAAFQQLASLRHYLMVSQDERRVELYTRDTGGWLFSIAGGADTELALEALGVVLRLDEVYEGTSKAVTG